MPAPRRKPRERGPSVPDCDGIDARDQLAGRTAVFPAAAFGVDPENLLGIADGCTGLGTAPRAMTFATTEQPIAVTNRTMKSLFPSLLCLGTLTTLGAAPAPDYSLSSSQPADLRLAAYFQAETRRIQSNCLASVRTAEDWQRQRDGYRRQLQEMLGLLPWPERTDLQATITGRIESDGFAMEKLHYQSLPGLYVTANLYLPKPHSNAAPAILYVCGHARVSTDGVSFGNKTGYQHHGAWFARNGYVCLVVDTIQLGEIEGVHHGTYREGMWWWNSRGYTPAGVEAWNGLRAFDYLETRPEVDPTRFGVTGRSGGGAYSWWIAALDDRIRVAAPVAGITDLQNHVVDGTVEGHCDCMFLVNTYRWDYAQVAALVAPRPLLLANSDKDTIFPLDGVVRVHSEIRRIYEMLGAADRLGLLITEGPHKDTQDLQVPVLRWFNRHLRNEDPLIVNAAERMFPPEQLRAFTTIPVDERTSRIHETFVPTARRPAVPTSAGDWTQQRASWMAALENKVFGGWPAPTISAEVRVERTRSAKHDKVRLETWELDSQPFVSLELQVLRRADGRRPVSVVLEVVDQAGWEAWAEVIRVAFGERITPPAEGRTADTAGTTTTFADLRRRVLEKREVHALLAPRGVGPDSWTGDVRKQTQIRRRFQLLGQTLDGMRVWDILRAIEALRRVPGLGRAPLTVKAEGTMGVNVLYASLFAPGIARLELRALPSSHQAGPDYLNVLRFLDLDCAAAMAAERTRVQLRGVDPADWTYPLGVSRALGWPPERFEVRD